MNYPFTFHALVICGKSCSSQIAGLVRNLHVIGLAKFVLAYAHLASLGLQVMLISNYTTLVIKNSVAILTNKHLTKANMDQSQSYGSSEVHSDGGIISQLLEKSFAARNVSEQEIISGQKPVPKLNIMKCMH